MVGDDSERFRVDPFRTLDVDLLALFEEARVLFALTVSGYERLEGWMRGDGLATYWQLEI